MTDEERALLASIPDEVKGHPPMIRYYNGTTGVAYDKPFSYQRPFGPNLVTHYDLVLARMYEERDEHEYRVRCARREHDEKVIWADFKVLFCFFNDKFIFD